jgi:hypothetical protein
MIEEERDPQVRHQTVRGARNALAHRLISQESYRAVLRGELSLADAKAIGRDGVPATDTTEGRSGPGTAGTPARGASGDAPDTPPQPGSRISKDDTRQFCWCGCEQLTSPGKRWRPGHDQRGKGIIKQAVKESRVEELDVRLREYGTERGLI